MKSFKDMYRKGILESILDDEDDSIKSVGTFMIPDVLKDPNSALGKCIRNVHYDSIYPEDKVKDCCVEDRMLIFKTYVDKYNAPIYSSIYVEQVPDLKQFDLLGMEAWKMVFNDRVEGSFKNVGKLVSSMMRFNWCNHLEDLDIELKTRPKYHAAGRFDTVNPYHGLYSIGNSGTTEKTPSKYGSLFIQSGSRLVLSKCKISGDGEAKVRLNVDDVTFKDVQSTGVDTLVIYDPSMFGGGTIGYRLNDVIIDPTYTFQCWDLNKKQIITRKGDIAKLAAFVTNSKRYSELAEYAPFKLRDNAKLTDLIDVSKMKGLREVAIRSNNISIRFIKDLRSAKMYWRCNKVEIPMTADNWYVVYIKEF